MQNTDYLKLNMPELSDKANILKLSENMEWIDSVIKTLNELQAAIEQRLSRLEYKGETTDAAITSIRTDVSSLIRGVDGLIVRVNSLETSQTAMASRVNTLSDRLTAEVTDITRNINTLETKLTALATLHNTDMKTVNEKLSEVSANMSTMLNQVIAINSRVATYDKAIADLQIQSEKSEKTIEKLDGYFKLV